MQVTLYLSAKRREVMLHEALVSGFRRHGEQVQYIATADYRGPIVGCDLAVFVGVKSNQMFREHQQVGQQTLLIDKAYFDRHNAYRLSLGGFQPFYLDDMHAEHRRLGSLDVTLLPRRRGGRNIIYAGSSQKYCNFHDLGDCNAYAVNAVAMIKARVGDKFRIIYRPKPSWWVNETKGKIVPHDARLSGPNESFARLMAQAYCVVTHGSNAAIESLSQGVPVVLLSDAKQSGVHALAERSIENVKSPYWPSDEARLQVMANLAWCQFSIPEIASGLAWDTIRKWLVK